MDRPLRAGLSLANLEESPSPLGMDRSLATRGFIATSSPPALFVAMVFVGFE